jgi:hypothetical protein
MTEILVCRDEKVKPFRLGLSQQIAVLEITPTFFVSRRDNVIRQVIS